MSKIAALLIIVCCINVSCHKKPQRELSHDKVITSFGIKLNDSVYYEGIIRNDSILVKVSHGVRLDSLTALIEYKGQSISPLAANTVDFSHPVVFTVTAEDGTATAYTVMIANFTSVKEITGFTFKVSDNSGFQSNVDGIIQDNLISVVLPSGADITRLKPSITYKGESISPVNGAVSDFTNVITYTVTADDKSTQSYTVLVFYNKMVFVGSADGNVYALSAATGKVEWKYNTHYPVSHAIYKDGIVYTGSSDGTFYALDGTTGSLKWKFFDQKINYSAPMVTPGIVYVSYYITRNMTGVYAIDSKTGSLIWKKRIGNTAISAPAFDGSLLYVSDFDFGLCAMDGATGDIKWKYYPGISMSNPAVANGTVFISAEIATICAVDSHTGTLKWTYRGEVNTQSAPTVLNGVVYVGAGNIYAINAGSGSLEWNSVITGMTQISLGSPSILGGLIFAGNYDGYLFAFDLATGAEKWRYNNSEGLLNNWLPGTVAAHGMLVTDRGDNVLKAFYASTGKLIWTFTAGGQVTYPCILDTEGNAFYAAATGNVN